MFSKTDEERYEEYVKQRLKRGCRPTSFPEFLSDFHPTLNKESNEIDKYDVKISITEKVVPFEELFPSFKGHVYMYFAATFNGHVGVDAINQEDIRKHCLDKQKVKEAINKHIPKYKCSHCEYDNNRIEKDLKDELDLE